MRGFCMENIPQLNPERNNPASYNAHTNGRGKPIQLLTSKTSSNTFPHQLQHQPASIITTVLLTYRSTEPTLTIRFTTPNHHPANFLTASINHLQPQSIYFIKVPLLPPKVPLPLQSRNVKRTNGNAKSTRSGNKLKGRELPRKEACLTRRKPIEIYFSSSLHRRKEPPYLCIPLQPEAARI